MVPDKIPKNCNAISLQAQAIDQDLPDTDHSVPLSMLFYTLLEWIDHDIVYRLMLALSRTNACVWLYRP